MKLSVELMNSIATNVIISKEKGIRYNNYVHNFFSYLNFSLNYFLKDIIIIVNILFLNWRLSPIKKIIKSIHYKEDNPLLFPLHHEHRQKNIFASIDQVDIGYLFWYIICLALAWVHVILRRELLW